MSLREERKFVIICDRCDISIPTNDPLTVPRSWSAFNSTEHLSKGHLCPDCCASFSMWFAKKDDPI